MQGKLSLKQRKFWKHYQKTHNLIESAKYVGSKGKDNQTLSVIGHQILRSLNLSMPELLDAQGLTDEAMTKPLQDGIQAKKTLVATWEGKITDRLEVDDHPSRAKFVEIYHRLKGNFIDKHEITGRDGGEITIEIKPAKKKGQKQALSFD